MMIRVFSTCCFVFAVFATNSQSAFSQEAAFVGQDKVDAVVLEQMSQQKLVGVAIGIIQDGKIVYTKGYGFQDREEKIPTTTNTVFRWASISKPVTAVAAMQLVQQGKLGLGDDVRKYVSEFPDPGHVVRVRDLMCHQSGIVHYFNGSVVRTKRQYESEHPFEDVILALDSFKESPLVHPPGENYSYSTHAYILLSAVVQRAGEEKFFDQVNRRICEPLNLSTLQPDYQWREIENRAVGYRNSSLRKGTVVPSSNTDVSWKLGGGGFVSNVKDLAGFAAGLLADDLMNAETKRAMFTIQELNDGTPTQLGLGVFVNENSISHNGSQEKTRTRMEIWPESNSGIVVMSNSEYANVGRVMTAIKNAMDHD